MPIKDPPDTFSGPGGVIPFANQSENTLMFSLNSRVRALLILAVREFLLLLGVSITLSQSAFCTTVDFEGANDLDSFTVSTLNPGPTLTPIASGGVANSRALQVDAVHNNVDATWNDENSDFSDVGSQLHASVFFKFQDFSLPPFNSRGFIAVGFSGENTTGLRLSSDDTFGVQLWSNESEEITLFVVSSGGGTGFSRTVPLTDGTWYQLAGGFENLGTEIAFTAKVSDFGPDGTLFQGVVDSVSFILTTKSQTILSDDSVWAGFTASSEGGTDLVDNFAFGPSVPVVPEPACSTLFAIAACLLTLPCRRHRSGNGKAVKFRKTGNRDRSSF